MSRARPDRREEARAGAVDSLAETNMVQTGATKETEQVDRADTEQLQLVDRTEQQMNHADENKLVDKIKLAATKSDQFQLVDRVVERADTKPIDLVDTEYEVWAEVSPSESQPSQRAAVAGAGRGARQAALEGGAPGSGTDNDSITKLQSTANNLELESATDNLAAAAERSQIIAIAE